MERRARAASKKLRAIERLEEADRAQTAEEREKVASKPRLQRLLAAPPIAVRPLEFDVKLCVAPMVGQSDLPFRLLCRRHGATCCYTQMLDAEALLGDDGAYLERALLRDARPEDRPLVVQIAGSDPATMAGAAKLLAQSGAVDAVDVNLGCPLADAYAKGYGAALLEQPERVRRIVEAMVAAVGGPVSGLPVFCKVRLLPWLEETLDFCQMLERAGCRLIAVHGRLACASGDRNRRHGAADLESVARVKAALLIPVLSNGNVRAAADVEANLLRTACDGVMVAEALLQNPALFAPLEESVTETATSQAALVAEYLALAAECNPLQSAADVECARRHVSWMLGRSGFGARLRYLHARKGADAGAVRGRLDAAATLAELAAVAADVLP